MSSEKVSETIVDLPQLPKSFIGRCMGKLCKGAQSTADAKSIHPILLTKGSLIGQNKKNSFIIKGTCTNCGTKMSVTSGTPKN